MGILERTQSHIGGQLSGYNFRLYSWSDILEGEQANFVLLKLAGTGGESDALIQRPDVDIRIVVDGSQSVQGYEDLQSIVRYFRDNWKGSGVLHFEPLSPIAGPIHLTNGRHAYDVTVRLITIDQ